MENKYPERIKVSIKFESKTQISINTYKEIKKVENKIVRIFLIILGTFFLILGIIGLIMPIMPGTIFLIMATACYIRSSDRMHLWLINNRWIGKYARSYFEERAMPLKAKIFASGMMWFSITSSMFLLESIFFKSVFILIGIMTTAYFMSLKTLKVN